MAANVHDWIIHPCGEMVVSYGCIRSCTTLYLHYITNKTQRLVFSLQKFVTSPQKLSILTCYCASERTVHQYIDILS